MKKSKKMEKFKASQIKIIEATCDVIKKYSISGTRMHLVAEEIDMAQSNLHYYFKTKKELLTAVLLYIEKMFVNERNNLLKNSEDTLEAKLKCYFDQKINVILKEKKYDIVQLDFWCQCLIDKDLHVQYNNFYIMWRDDLFAMIREYLPDIMDDKLHRVAHIMMSLLKGASMQYYTDPYFELDKHFDACLSLCLKFLNE